MRCTTELQPKYTRCLMSQQVPTYETILADTLQMKNIPNARQGCVPCDVPLLTDYQKLLICRPEVRNNVAQFIILLKLRPGFA